MNNANLQITERLVTREEYDATQIAVRQFPDLSFLKFTVVQHLSECYVAEVNGRFAGFCGIQYGFGWWKLGPIVVLPEYQKSGVGSALLHKVVEVSSKRPTYFGTSNTQVKEFGKSIGAREIGNFLQLPFAIKLAAAYFLLEYMSPYYLWESMRKYVRYGRGTYTYFLLNASEPL